MRETLQLHLNVAERNQNIQDIVRSITCNVVQVISALSFNIGKVFNCSFQLFSNDQKVGLKVSGMVGMVGLECRKSMLKCLHKC